MENTMYMKVVSDQRAMALTQEQATEGNTTISPETAENRAEGSLHDWKKENPALLMKLLRKLSPLDQDLNLSVYFLSKAKSATSNTFELLQFNLAQQVSSAWGRS